MEDNSSFSKIQRKVDEFIKEHGGYWPPLSMLAAIVEEVGEVAKEINHLERIKPKKEEVNNLGIGEELGDLLFALICLSNFYEVELSEELKKVMNKYGQRDKNRFT